MVSSPDDPIATRGKNSSDSSLPAKPQADWPAYVDTQHTFRLIDSILPFEACLYHQVLPLSLEGSRLKLGMVNLEDPSALDYVRRILAYMNCSLVPQTIPSHVHHGVLTAYLNTIGNKVKAKSAQASEKTPGGKEAGLQKNGAQSSHPVRDQNTTPTFLVDSPEEFVVDEPETFITAGSTLSESVPETSPTSSSKDTLSTLPSEQTDAPSQIVPPTPPQPTLVLNEENSPPQNAPPEAVESPGSALPVLQVSVKGIHETVETLATLPPKALVQELLGRILMGGIGRLFFERQAQHGRILWSQNGVLQSVLDNLSAEMIQGSINELKLLTRLPLLPVQKPKQVEIERLYQKHRILLRLRVMPGTYGEEATLQVLRGAALKFYQQQQLTTLSRDALGIAQDLQIKLNELRSRTHGSPLLTSDQLSILPELREVIKSIEQQLEELRAMQTDASGDSNLKNQD